MSHIHLWFKQLLQLCIMQFILHVSILCEFFKYDYRETVIMVYLVNDIRDYMGVQSIFGLFLQLNWKETTFVMSWKNIC
jgi:hypothetical protein